MHRRTVPDRASGPHAQSVYPGAPSGARLGAPVSAATAANPADPAREALAGRILAFLGRLHRPSSDGEVFTHCGSSYRGTTADEVRSVLEELVGRRRVRLVQGKTEIRRGATVTISLFPAYELKRRRRGGGR